MKPDLYRSLQALSNPDRMEIFKFINDIGGKIPFNLILKKIYPNAEKSIKSSSLSNHLRKLVENGILDKDSDGYYVTPLGKELSEHLINIEHVFHHFNKEMMVRTSDFCQETFNEKKIEDILIREANLNKKDAHRIATITKKRLIQANIEYLTTPLIREFLNVVLLESGFEEVRHKLTRLGSPPYDVKKLIQKAGFLNTKDLFSELGKNLFSQYLLLEQLPSGNADYYLTGRIFFNHPECWGLVPSELILPGKRFAEIIIKKYLNYQFSGTEESKENNLEIFSKVLMETMQILKDFFCSGIIITEFECAIRDLNEILKISLNSLIKSIFITLSGINSFKSYNPRHLTDEDWQLHIEITLFNSLNGEGYQEEIGAILNEYYIDYLKLHSTENTDSSVDKRKNLRRLVAKPHLLINISQDTKEKILACTDFNSLTPNIKMALESAIYHSISFINPYRFSKKEKNKKKILTPTLNPVQIENREFAGQNIIPRPQIVLDKMFINLPRILQISEEISDIPVFQGISKNEKYRGKIDKLKDQEKFFMVLKDWVYKIMNLFDNKFLLISKNIKNFKNWQSIAESLFGREFLSDAKELFEYSGNIKIICSISLNGLVETARYYTGLFPDQNDEAFSFLCKVISWVSELLKNNSKNKSVEYILSQPHLDNYLQLKYMQDVNLIQNMSSEYLNVDREKCETEFEIIRSLKGIESENPSLKRNYTITNYMDKEFFGNIPSTIVPYRWLIHRHDIQKDFDKILKEFHHYQDHMQNGSYFDYFINYNKIKKSNEVILKTYKAILENDIQNFGFSCILGENKEKYYNYAGCFKPLNYFEKLIRNSVINRKELII
ncbi:MAG: hypothetical protein GY870_00690 [archaeon]|nr:hypothetical protein [archaeon]